MCLCAYNIFRTIGAAPARLENERVAVAPLPVEPPAMDIVVAALGKPTMRERSSAVHRLVERWPLVMLILAAIALSIGSVAEIVPHLVQGVLTPKIASVTPYTPLELAGRDIYIREGCTGCHTQMVRTLRAETERYGTYTLAGENRFDRPFLWGSKRTGPDLAREGVIRPSAAWQYPHLVNPRSVEPGSIMPNYGWLATDDLDFMSLPAKIQVLAAPPLYTPYSAAEIANCVELAKSQAKGIADELRTLPEYVGKTDLQNKEIIAMIAYLQRLGTDLAKETAPAKEIR